MNVTIRLETDPKRLLKFLEDNSYGFSWSLDTISNDCISLRVDSSSDTVAYIWGLWSDPHTIDFHACSRLRLWLSRPVLHRLMVIAELFGATALSTTPAGPTKDRIAHLLTHLGFDGDGSGTYRLNLESTHGLLA